MSRWYKIKDKSPISSEEILRLRALIKRHEAKIKQICSVCTHTFEVLESGDGWDEWSVMDCEVEEWLHCTICGETDKRKTGRINRHY